MFKKKKPENFDEYTKQSKKISLEQALFFITSGLFIFYFWETEYKWNIVIISIIFFIILTAIRWDLEKPD